MSNGTNGNKSTWIIRFLLTCLWGATIGIFVFMGNKIYATDQNAITRDTDIEHRFENRIVMRSKDVAKELKCLNDKIDGVRIEQYNMRTDVLVAIAELKKDVKNR